LNVPKKHLHFNIMFEYLSLANDLSGKYGETVDNAAANN
jgi:hypothetical protein